MQSHVLKQIKCCERGSVAIELVTIVPILLLLIGFMVDFSRFLTISQEIHRQAQTLIFDKAIWANLTDEKLALIQALHLDQTSANTWIGFRQIQQEANGNTQIISEYSAGTAGDDCSLEYPILPVVETAAVFLPRQRYSQLKICAQLKIGLFSFHGLELWPNQISAAAMRHD